MSVLGYLQGRASDAVLTGVENASIDRSIATLQSRIKTHFGGALSSHFRFGSSTRDTILPRSMDEHSDIDYMLVFSEGGYNPQTYLDRLKRFANGYYQSSEIYQSSPTIVLELNHIKFELVPALWDGWQNSFKIPESNTNWRHTNPNDFNKSLEDANKYHSYLLKPTIRLAKYWNAQAGYIYDSYKFERFIKDLAFMFCGNQKEYLFYVFDNLNSMGLNEQWRREKLDRAKNIIANVREYEKRGLFINAEAEVQKLIP